MRTALLSALTILVLSAPAFADDNVIALPPAGTTLINLSATERAMLPQDTLNASLRIEVDGAQARDIQDKINKAMTEALAAAKQVPEIKTSTGGYYVYQYEDGQPDPKTGVVAKPVKKWRGNQNIMLEGTDSTKLLELTGKIQDMGFVMNNLDYTLSNAQSDKARDALMDKALRALGDKAKVAQAALGKGSYEIVDVSVDGSQPPVMPMYKTMMARAEGAPADAMAAPVAQAGETEISLTVTARVLLKP